MNVERSHEYVKAAMERREEPERRALDRGEERRSTYDRSRENIMYASYDREIIDAQLQALEDLKWHIENTTKEGRKKHLECSREY